MIKTQIISGLLLSIASILFSTPLNAQHCKYDFLGLIGVVPYFDDTNQIIDELHITLTDSLGNPVMQSQSAYNKKSQIIETDSTPFLFWRNPKSNKDVNHTNQDLKKRHFHFASNHYILVLDYRYIYNSPSKKDNNGLEAIQKFYLKIEDKDSLENGGYFEPIVLAVSSNSYLPLCGVPLTLKEVSIGYQPFFIKLAIPDDIINKATSPDFAANEISLYDSVSVVLDTLLDDANEFPVTLILTTDYYKKRNNNMIVVKRIICRNKWLSERVDRMIYELKDGKMVLIDYQQGAE